MRGLRALGKVLLAAASLQFSLFICEEGLQVLMFSSWAGKDLPKDLRETIVAVYIVQNELLRALNYAIGIWIPPFFLAYSGYVRAGEVWVQAQIAAHGLNPRIPELWWIKALGWSLGALILLALVSFAFASARSDRRRARPEQGGLARWLKGGGRT